MLKPSTKLQLGLSLIGIIANLTPALVQAQELRWALPVGIKAELHIFNTNTHDVDLYRKDWDNDHQAQEESFRLSPRSLISWSWNPLTKPTVLEASDAGLRVTWSPLNSKSFHSLQPGQSHALEFGVSSLHPSADLWLTNLSSQSQDGNILTWKSGSHEPDLHPFRLEAREIRRIPGAALPGTSFRIVGALNLNASRVDQEGRVQFPKFLTNQHPLPPPQGRYFVLANADRSTAFLVDLVDPNLQNEARLQIQNPHDLRPRILIAEIGLNENFSNRNWVDKYKFPWSWKVTQVIRFASLASQFCDGHPQMIEDHLEEWLAGAHAGGRPLICLWGYQIILELP